jgi:hypothetical protein
MNNSISKTIGLMASAFAGPAHAASLDSYVERDGQIVIALSGAIDTGDTERFRQLVREANASGRHVHGIWLNSGGGRLDEGVSLAGGL